METQTQDSQAAMTPQKAFEILRAGNARFAAGQGAARDLPGQVRATAGGQFPFAVVLGCVDSRAAPELIFDQGIGDIFSARVAGNFVNADILGSIEFACEVVGSRLIVVLGHTACGAIQGACDGVQLGNLTGLLEKLQPAVKAAQAAAGGPPPTPDEVAEINVRLALEEIPRGSPLLQKRLAEGKIGLVGAMYDVSTGRVRFL